MKKTASKRPHRKTKKERIELEKQFLSAVLADIDNNDLRQVTEKYNVTWRQFIDKRHQALWRILQTLDLSKVIEERVEILIEESGRTHEDIADDIGTTKELYNQAQGITWIEYELSAAGVFPLIGGKTYLRELSDTYAVPLAAPEFAKQLRFA